MENILPDAQQRRRDHHQPCIMIMLKGHHLGVSDIRRYCVTDITDDRASPSCVMVAGRVKNGRRKCAAADISSSSAPTAVLLSQIICKVAAHKRPERQLQQVMLQHGLHCLMLNNTGMTTSPFFQMQP